MNRNERGSTTVVVLAVILGLVILAGVIVGGYQLGWWLRKNEVNRSAKINRQSYEVQQTYREKALDDITGVRELDAQIADPAYASDVPQLRAARVALIRETCDAISRLTTSGAGVDPDVQSFHDQECAA